jgi:uncharacterized Fe-S cluster protein YjdI
MEDENQFTNNRIYRNEEITVYWKPGACVHASYCYRELLEVFDPSRRPWVDMEAAPTERIIEVVDLCPTEALTWKWNDEEKNESIGPEHPNHVKYRRPDLAERNDELPEKEDPAVIKIMTDGPIVIKGSFTLKYDETTKDIVDSLTSLCRCGKSNNQPFCDGQHRKIGFKG